MAMMDCVPVPLHLLQSPAWRAMSESARALWLDLAGLAWQSKYRGFVCDPMGRPWNLEAIARLTGNSSKEILKWLKELEQFNLVGVTSDGILFCPHLVEQVAMLEAREQLKQKRREAGLKGARCRWRNAQKIGNDAHQNGKNGKPNSKPDSKQDGKPDGKSDGKPDSKPDGKQDSKPNSKPDATFGRSGFGREFYCAAKVSVERRKLNGHRHLEQPGYMGGIQTSSCLECENIENSPPNTPPQEISHGGGGVGERLGVTGVLRGVLGGKRGAKGEGERGSQFLDPVSKSSEASISEIPNRPVAKIQPLVPSCEQPSELQSAPQAEKTSPVMGLTDCPEAKLVASFGPHQTDSVPGQDAGTDRKLPLALPPKPPNWAAVEDDWHRLGRFWPGGEPKKPRDRKLLWRLLGYAHWPENPNQQWARAVLEAFVDAAGQAKNPGAYLERLVREIGQREASQEIRLLLRQIETPDWIRRLPEQNRSPPKHVSAPDYPIFEYLEANERKQLQAEWRAIHSELLAILGRAEEKPSQSNFQ